jgi:hypothetical protein
LSFNFDFEVFPAKPPWFVAKIYPLFGFDSPIEYEPLPAISMPTGHTNMTCSLEIPFLEFSPLQHLDFGELPWMSTAAPIANVFRV